MQMFTCHCIAPPSNIHIMQVAQRTTANPLNYRLSWFQWIGTIVILFSNLSLQLSNSILRLLSHLSSIIGPPRVAVVRWWRWWVAMETSISTTSQSPGGVLVYAENHVFLWCTLGHGRLIFRMADLWQAIFVKSVGR